MSKQNITRKLQFIGNSFYTTLPSNWVSNFGLKKGDEIIMRKQDDGSLVILPNTTLSPEEDKELVLEFYPEIGAEVREKCLSGVERIVITAQNPIETAELKRIRYFVDKVPTTRIISETTKEIIIQNFGVKNLPSREMVHGMFSMTSDLFESLRISKTKENNEEVQYKLEKIMDFYTLLIQYIRTYQTQGYLHPKDYQNFNHKKASDFRTLANSIRAIAYKLSDLRNYDSNTFEQAFDYYQEIEQYFNDTFDSFLKNGKQHHKKAYSLYFDLLWERGVQLKEEFEGDVRFLIKDLISIYHDISDILFVINIID